MPSTRNKVIARPSFPTRQQPTRACKRSAGDLALYSSQLTKRARTRNSNEKTQEILGHLPQRVRSNSNYTPNNTRSDERPRSATNTKRKQSTTDEDINDNGFHHEDVKPTKRRRLQSTRKDLSPFPQKTEPKPWKLPLELLYMIYDHFWDTETFECGSPKTLRSCALTCSHWRNAVRPYIFRFITLDSTEKIEKFAAQIRDQPGVTQWVRKLRLEGKTLPWIDGPRWRLENVEQDIDQWLYAFPAVLDTHFPYLKTFELFNFAQVSPRLEDREAFARWIPSLKTLESVTTLNILRCEMSNNNLTALVRALPRLTRADFVNVNFTHPNWAILYTPCSSDARTELPQEAFVEPTELLQAKCPVLYPPPSLQEFRLDNSHVLYDYFTFDLLCDWFRAESSGQCLKSLELSSEMEETSLRDFIYALGVAPKLSHLQVPIGPDVEVIESGMDISPLTNLSSIRLMGHEDQWGDEIVDIVHLFLYQLNAPRLREISVTICFEKEEDIAAIATIDRILADVKFNSLEVVRIELHPTLLETGGKGYQVIQKVKTNFPLLAKRGILEVKFILLDLQYLDDTLGMT